MRRLAPVVAVVVLLLSGCGPTSRPEVETNSGGVLDCPSATVSYAAIDSDLSQPGAPSPLEAAPSWIGGEFMPDGIPRIESEADDRAIIAVVDFEANRVGRILMIRHEGGWYVQGTEACG